MMLHSISCCVNILFCPKSKHLYFLSAKMYRLMVRDLRAKSNIRTTYVVNQGCAIRSQMRPAT